MEGTHKKSGIAHIANYELLPHADQGSERNGSHQSHLSPFCAASIFRCYCCPLKVQRMQPHTLAQKHAYMPPSAEGFHPCTFVISARLFIFEFVVKTEKHHRRRL
jgi:hypothetical protein